MKSHSASLLVRVSPQVDENNNEIQGGDTDVGDTTKIGTSQKSFGKGFLIVTCLLAVSLGIQGTSAAVAQDALAAAKLAEIESLRKGFGLENAEWTKRMSKDEMQQEPEVCYDQGCLDASLDLLNAINSTVDPCDNFFQFACGKWLANNPVPSTSSRWSRFNGLRDEVNNITQTILNEEIDNDDAKPVNQVKEFYKECINVEKLEAAGVAPITKLIEEFGGWPLMNPSDWDESQFDWIKSVGELRRRLLDDAIISVYAERDMKNVTQLVVYLDQPSFGLPRSILIDADNYPTLIAAYKTLIVEIARGLGSTESTANLEAAADAIIEMEAKLASISLSDEDRYEIEAIYHPFKLNDFQAVTDAIDSTFSVGWKSLLDQIFSSSGVAINADEQLNVAGLSYLLKLIPILKETPPKVIADYIGLRIATGVASGTTEAMRAILFKFSQALTGAKEPPTRESTCANSANNNFGMAIGVKYIEAAFDIEAKGIVDELVSNLIVSFRELLDEADWMEDSTKTEAEAKVGTIRSFMAFPEWLENKTAVEQYFNGLELVSGPEAFFQSVLSIGQWSSDQTLSLLRLPTTQDEWLTYPGVVNAFYSPVHNSITFPAGILQPPFFGKLRPASQNYGGIGVVIGHEITHGFDNQGAQYDKNGNAINWWDPVTLEKFNEKAQCIIDQYSKFYAPNVDMYVNGQLTQGENIADNGGLRESFRAYRKYVEELGKEEGRLPGLEDLTPNQLFFLGYANIWCESITDEGLINQILTDPHSPAQFRVIGPLRNSKEFAEAYACPVNADGMNPPEAEKCTVW